MMRVLFGSAALAVAALGAALSGPAMAQGGDLGRLLQEGGILPRAQPDPRQQAVRDRAIYEQGRRDEEGRREEFRRRREAEREDRRFEGRRGDERGDPRYGRPGEYGRGDGRGPGPDRRRAEEDRRRYEEERGFRRD